MVVYIFKGGLQPCDQSRTSVLDFVNVLFTTTIFAHGRYGMVKVKEMQPCPGMQHLNSDFDINFHGNSRYRRNTLKYCDII